MSTSPDKANSHNVLDLPNVRWQFIDSSKNSRANLTQVKRHVMQEYMRQKKGSTRQSESEEERSQRKRGRPKKSRGIRRRSEKKTTSESDGDSPRPRERRSISKQLAARITDSSNLKFCNDLVQDPITSNALNESDDITSILSFQASHAQPGASSLPTEIDSFAEAHSPTSQNHDLNFNNILWSPTSTTSYQSINSSNDTFSASCTDQLTTLPIELDQDGQRSFDSCVNDLLGCSYEPPYHSAIAPSWATAASVQEEIKGKFPNIFFHHHRDQDGTILGHHLLNTPRDTSDAAIISCLGVAVQEELDPRPGHREISWVQMRAAREMIQARGGPAAFTNSPIGMLINWQDHVLSGHESHRTNLLHEHEQPTVLLSEPWSSSEPQVVQTLCTISAPMSSETLELSPSPEPRTILPFHSISSSIDEIKLQCEEFIDFIRRCEQLALFQRENPQVSYMIRHTAVQETSILHQILMAPLGGQFTERSQTVTRLTTLMILNAALWDYRYTPAHTATFFSTLERAMIDKDVGMNGSVEAVLQILLKCHDGSLDHWPTYANDVTSAAVAEYLPDFSQYYPTATSPSARPWFVGRMLKIAMRLSAFSWYRVSELLISCLTLQVQHLSTTLWETELRTEILGAPLANYDVHS